jgi:hypothetical protein
MKLWDLLENSSLLQPGEKKIRDDLSLRRAQDIQNKIHQLLDSLASSESLSSMFQQDQQLQSSLEKLKKRIDLKVSYLQRMQLRPDNGMTRMFAILDRECSDFLPVMKVTGKMLYRGLRTDVSVFEGRSREDRAPKDSRTEISNRLDQALRNHGFQALRSNSIFTTTSRDFASNYGSHIYCIFPKNGVHVLTTNVGDLILSSYDSLVGAGWQDNFMISLRNWLMDNVPEWRDTPLGKEISGYNYDDDVFWEIQNNFNDGNPLKLPDEFNKTKEDLLSDEAIMNHLEPRSDDLENAMIDGREILINGEYWALRLDQWKQYIIDRYLEGNDPNPW